MAVLSVEREPDSMAGTWNRLWQRTYTEKFRVVCSDILDGPVTIRTALDGLGHQWLPLIGTHYQVSSTEFDLGSLATDVTYEPQGVGPMSTDGTTHLPVLGREWLVTYQYGPYDGGEFGADPLSWKLMLSFGEDQYQRIVFVDEDGNPILNSAKCPYEEPVQVDDSRSVITAVRREAIGGTSPFDFAKGEYYRNTVNDDVWNTFTARTVMLRSVTTGQPEYDSNARVYFYTVTYVFHINRDGWTKQILDQGFQVLGTDGEPTPVIAADGDRVDDAVLLDGSGHELGSGGTPVYRSHRVFPDRDFSALSMNFAGVLGR